MNNLELGRYEHEQLLKNPEYRMMLMMEDLEYRMTPSLAQNEPDPQLPPAPTLQEHLKKKLHKLDELEGKFLYLQNRINEHLDKSYKKKRFTPYTL